jgi:hypothetical protein
MTQAILTASTLATTGGLAGLFLAYTGGFRTFRRGGIRFVRLGRWSVTVSHGRV